MSTHIEQIISVIRDGCVGLDFDNTISCYDGVFYQMALERNFIPESVGVMKNEVRDHLRAMGQEDVWTELQGIVYTEGMCQVRPYPGVLDFIRRCRQSGTSIVLVSHKTRYPYIGERRDMHEAAWNWLVEHQFVGEDRLAEADIYFEISQNLKIERIKSCQCNAFIDDLSEFLQKPSFPVETKRVLFSPNGEKAQSPLVAFHEWDWLTKQL